MADGAEDRQDGLQYEGVRNGATISGVTGGLSEVPVLKSMDATWCRAPSASQFGAVYCNQDLFVFLVDVLMPLQGCQVVARHVPSHTLPTASVCSFIPLRWPRTSLLVEFVVDVQETSMACMMVLWPADGLGVRQGPKNPNLGIPLYIHLEAPQRLLPRNHGRTSQ